MRVFKKVLHAVLVVDMVLMVLLITLQIVSRYVFNNPNTWSEEASRYALVYMTFLGGALSMLRGNNLKVTMLVERFSPRVQAFLDLFMQCLSIVFLVTVVIYSYPVLVRLASQPTPALNISKSLVMAAVPLGCLGMTVALLEQAKAAYLKLSHLGKGGAK